MTSSTPERAVPSKGLVLGVDLGTTTVKACLVSAEEGGSAVSSLSRETKATLASDLGSLGSEQDAHKICTALQFCLSQLPKEQLARVTRVAVSGQMHGVVLWKHDSGWKRNAFGRFDVDVVSALYTWQDGRCSAAFLDSLPRPRSHLRLSSGHGCATLFWLLKHRARELERFDRAGAVQDLVVAMLCGLDRPVMSTQTAASWGYFDTVAGQWNTDLLREGGFLVDLLPDVVEPGAVAGRLEHPWYGIPAGTPVHAALGDMQCSALSVGAGETDAVLNMSTSAQLSFLLEPSFVPPTSLDTGSTLEAFPYFGGRYLAVAASLNGGNVLAVFVRMLQQWMHQLGTGIPESAIWDRLLAAGTDERSAASANAQASSGDAATPPPPDLVVTPTVFGERHMPGARASVSGIGPQSALSLGPVLRALCQGLARNLHTMMPGEMLERAGVRRIVGTGKALTRNVCLQQAVHDVYGIPLELGGKGDAALGAALAVLAHSSSTKA